MPEISPLALELQYYPVFLRQVGSALQLSAAEQRLAGSIKPDGWAYWSLANLSGDERVPYPHKDDAAKWFADASLPLFASELDLGGVPALDLRGGTLSHRLDALYRSPHPSQRRRFEAASKTLADWTYTFAASVGIRSAYWRSLVSDVPQLAVKSDKRGALGVEFPGQPENRYPIDGPVGTIINLGPGLTGGYFAGNLIDRTNVIHFVSGGKAAHYVNRCIDQHVRAFAAGTEHHRSAGTLAKELPPGANPVTAHMPEARYYTDGIAEALGRLGMQQVTADIVVMSAVHQAGPQECLAGVAGAKQLLRPGGLLLIKAPDVSLSDEAGMDTVFPEAVRRFGSPAIAGACGTLQQRLDPALPLDRPASYAIFKQV